MSPAPINRDARSLLLRWAAGDALAIDALVAVCLPALRSGLGADQASEIGATKLEVALRRVLAVAPRFVVSLPARLTALVQRLVECELASSTGTGPREPTREEAAAIVLDLDRGRSQSEPQTPAEKNAWLKLGLMLLERDERTLLVGHWAGMSDAALAARLGATAGDVAKRKAAAMRVHAQLVQQLERGALDDALRADEAAGSPSDPWGMPTQWSMVLGAVAKDDGSRVQQSWQRLLDRYRDPIRLAIRRGLHTCAPSEDLVDEFFSYLFEHNVLAKVDPGNGKFRAYIQAVLKRFLLKQGRGQLDAAELDEQVAPATEAADLAAERADEAEWAAHVLRLALADLAQRLPRDGDVLVRYYGIAAPESGTARAPQRREQIAAELGMTLGSVDQATYRGRRLLRTCIERELRETVNSAGDYATEAGLVTRRLLEAYPGLL